MAKRPPAKYKTNDTKYTEEWVLNELNAILEELNSNPDYVYIWELFEKKPYSRSRYWEWIDKYSDNDKIKQISCSIKEILESRVVWGALKNKLNGTFTMFHLKNNYWWKDKTEVDNTNKNVNYDSEDDEDFKSVLSDNWLI